MIVIRYFAPLIIAATACLPRHAPAADLAPNPEVVQRLEQRVDELARELAAMKNEIAALRAQNEALATAQQQHALQSQQASLQSTQPASVRNTVPAPVAGADSGLGTPALGISENLSLWGYGEIYYSHPTGSPADTQFDLARAVFGIGYRFDERTQFNSEFEVEHSVASASDKGEFEVEQFYVDRQLAPWISVKAGLFLMPFGLLNEHHEPINYYGVQRNFVETLIIPSTWREGGFAFHGNSDFGLNWDAGVTTGFSLRGWDFNPENPLYRTALELENSGIAPLQATHQELSLANAQHLSQYLALNYTGVAGLKAGAAIFSGQGAVPTVPLRLPRERVTLWEAHALWTAGAAEWSAVYARGRISNTEAINLANAGGSNPLPGEFLGYYLQGAYTLWQDGEYRLAPFARWEHYDLGASFEGIPPGLSAVPAGPAADGRPWPQPRDRVLSVGANFYVTPHVVFKVDYQSFDVNKDLTRFDIGMGLAF